MKVGKTVCVMCNPLSAMIYATNMIPQEVGRRPYESKADFQRRVEEAKEQYELLRQEAAAKHGELDE